MDEGQFGAEGVGANRAGGGSGKGSLKYSKYEWGRARTSVTSVQHLAGVLCGCLGLLESHYFLFGSAPTCVSR